MALRTPQDLLGCFGPADPREPTSVIRLPVGGTLSSQALVFLNAGDGFSHQVQAHIRLGTHAERHSQRGSRSALTE